MEVRSPLGLNSAVKKTRNRQSNWPTNGPTDGPSNRLTDGPTGGLTGGPTDGWTDPHMELLLRD